MTIFELGALGEFVGSIAVVGTFIYLAIQIRQNTEAVRGTTIHAITQSQQSELRWGSDISEVFTKAIENPGELNSSEAWKLNQWLVSAMAARQNEFLQHRKGLMGPEVWKASENIILMLLSIQWVRNWWITLGKESYASEFVDLVNSFFAQEVTQVDFVDVLQKLKTGGV